MRLRYESWGAWARLESMPALVALDRDGVRSLGLDGGAAWERERPPRPIEAHVAVTSRCSAGCEGCYLDATPHGTDVPQRDLLAAMDALERGGVFVVAFGGGEPLLRDDIGDLAREARRRGLSPVMTTSGLGLTDAKAACLTDFSQINVSYDGTSADYRAVRGFDGAPLAERAIAMLRRHDIRVGVNVVMTRDTFDRLDFTLDRARECGAMEAQLLRYKPAGRAARLDYLARRLSREQVLAFPSRLRALSERLRPLGFPIRIDCSLVPFLSSDDDLLTRARDFETFGVMGCEAGNALTALRADGRVAPCSFAAPSTLGINALIDGSQDETIALHRDHSRSPPAPCDTCPLRSICKGGCRVVASYLGDVHAPDPECPRVTG